MGETRRQTAVRMVLLCCIVKARMSMTHLVPIAASWTPLSLVLKSTPSLQREAVSEGHAFDSRWQHVRNVPLQAHHGNFTHKLLRQAIEAFVERRRGPAQGSDSSVFIKRKHQHTLVGRGGLNSLHLNMTSRSCLP